MFYRIVNNQSSVVLGTYAGQTADEALDTMATHEGYDDFRDLALVGFDFDALQPYEREEFEDEFAAQEARVEEARSHYDVVEVD